MEEEVKKMTINKTQEVQNLILNNKNLKINDETIQTFLNSPNFKV